jgi:hypothetical protein
VSLTFTDRPFPFLFLHKSRSPTVDGGAVAPASLYRPENAKTGPLVRLTPNSTLGDTNPSTNCTIWAWNLSVHGDGDNREQFKVFPVILHVLAQLAGSRSIKSTQECWNKSEAVVNGVAESWPRWAHSRWRWEQNWGKSQIGELWGTIGGEGWFTKCTIT